MVLLSQGTPCECIRLDLSGEFWFGAGAGGREVLLLLKAGCPKGKERDENKDCHKGPIPYQVTWDSRGRKKLGQKRREAVA